MSNVVSFGKLTPIEVISDIMDNVASGATKKVVVVELKEDDTVHASWSNMTNMELAFMVACLYNFHLAELTVER